MIVGCDAALLLKIIVITGICERDNTIVWLAKFRHMHHSCTASGHFRHKEFTRRIFPELCAHRWYYWQTRCWVRPTKAGSATSCAARACSAATARAAAPCSRCLWWRCARCEPAIWTSVVRKYLFVITKMCIPFQQAGPKFSSFNFPLISILLSTDVTSCS